MSTVREDGVYVGLSEKDYFSSGRLGSSDMVKLCGKNPEKWWYASQYNLKRKPYEADEATTFGSALHAYVLEGEKVFLERFVKKPNSYVSDKGEIKPWNGNATFCRNWLEEQEKANMSVLSPEAWDSVYEMGELILNHPEMGGVLKSGMAEVSVFFTMGGVKCRARFDRLLVGLICDLKSFGSHIWYRDDLYTCMKIVRDRKYDVQRACYDYARQQMKRLVENGQVFGASEKQLAFLKAVAENEDYKWAWLFFQKPNHSEKNPAAPVVVPITRPRNDFTYVRGCERIEIALKNYDRLVETFGLEIPWVKISPTAEPEDSEFARLYEPSEAEPEPEEESEDEGL